MNIDIPHQITEGLDYSTLSWVKDEIGKSLEQTQLALERFAAHPEDNSQARYCVTYLHQVFGTLQMVEIFGAALLAEEMEKTARALLQDKSIHSEQTLDALMRAIIQLPAYLENLEQGHPDIPAVLTPLINDLRTARNDPLLTDTAFFYPDLDVVPPQPVSSSNKALPDSQTYARKLRPVFQAALLSWLRDKQDKSSLKKLAAVLRELHKTSSADAAQRSWWIMGGLIEALNDGGLDASRPHYLMLSQMDMEIKRLIRHGESVISEEPPEALLKSCLYHIGHASSHGPLVSTLQSAFKLTQLIPLDVSFDQAIDALKGSNTDIMRNVTAIIKNDLLEVNEFLDVFVRNIQSKNQPLQNRELQPLVTTLNRTADTLEMLGRQELRKIILDQAHAMQHLLDTSETPDEALLMEIASALLYVESTLDNLTLFADHTVQTLAPDFSRDVDSSRPAQVLLPANELQKFEQHVFEEMLDTLSFVKTGLNRFADQSDTIEDIRDIPEKLKQINGTLTFMGQEKAARLINAINAFIEQRLLTAPTTISMEQLDTLADAITSIEFFIEALAEGRPRPEMVLTVADISVEQLGFPASEQAVVSPFLQETTTARIPLPEPQSDSEHQADDAISNKLADLEKTSQASQDETLIDNPVFDPALAEVFRLETRNHLATIRAFLEDTKEQDSAPVSEELYLGLHALDDSARSARIELITHLSQPMVTLVRELYDNLQPLNANGLTILNTFAHTIETLVQQFDNPQAINTDYHQLLAQIHALQTEHSAGSEPELTLNEPEERKSSPPQTDIDSLTVSSDDDPTMFAVFVEEAEELQEKTDHILTQWRQNIENLQPVAELQRALHTLKGIARMANVLAISDLAHTMESLLEGLSARRFRPRESHPALLQACQDWLARALENARQGQSIEPAEQLLAQLNTAIEEGDLPETTDSPPTAPEPTTDFRDDENSNNLNELIEFIGTFSLDAEQEAKRPAATPASVEEQIRVRADLLNELVNHSGEINIFNARIAQQVKEWQFNLGELQHTVDRLRDQLRQFEIEAETQIIYRHEPGAAELKDFDPLEMDRFSNMQQLSRGMVESLSDLTSIEHMLEHLSVDTDELLLQQQHITSELQEGLMRTRMVSFTSVLPRLRRIIRQTCNETRKYAELNVSGVEVELDRSQLNSIVTIIEHILRNAVDHGIEAPDKRESLGKNRVGQLYLDCQHQGSEIILTINDDGAGINIENLRAHAIKQGLMREDQELPDDEVLRFVYHSGFSTAESLTQISGRGLGLDVVNAEVNQLGGTLKIDSETGKGASFTLHFPLTLLINQALMVRVVDASYGIQLAHVEHVVRVGRQELEPLFSGHEHSFVYAGNEYPYLNLGLSFYGQASPLPEQDERLSLLLLRNGEQRLAAHVDQLLGRQEIVIKPIGPQLDSIEILSGASILPDGQVALILDVAKLFHAALDQEKGRHAQPLMASTEVYHSAQDAPRVLVVDDSITMRKVTARLLTRYHYTPLTAKDGEEALQLMEDTVPDIILVDVEMPHMDGYELATRMRASPRLKQIPIIMITSRSGEKHRQRALDIGVDVYMGKPFQEKELINHIQALTLNNQDLGE